MPTAEIKKHFQSQQCEFDVPADKFVVNYGHKNRDSIVIRLEEGEQVYICDFSESRFPDKTVSATIPFSLFAKKLPSFIHHLAAINAKNIEDEKKKSSEQASG